MTENEDVVVDDGEGVVEPFDDCETTDEKLGEGVYVRSDVGEDDSEGDIDAFDDCEWCAV